ncbi:MAG TPA: tyrosine-protein phosphatase [Verrucomicrobiae bacterium]|jgi:protein tyrosine/serine phosphatase
MNRSRKVCFFVAMLLLLVMALPSLAQQSTNRPADWAQPVVVPGITNCYEVTTNLYRGAQPSLEGMKQLKAMGIKTVINLRAFHSDDDKVAGTGLNDVRFEMYPWHGDEDEVVKFLKVTTDTNDLPVFVHCERGADRTGMMCAMYRIVVCGWTKQQAIDEMEHGGFRFSPVWENLVTFIRKADIDEIKHRVGLQSK